MIRTTYKHRLDRLSWNKTSHVCLKMVEGATRKEAKTWICHPLVGLEKHNFAASQSGLNTHNHRVVPIQAIEPSPTGIHAVKQIST